MTTPKETDDWSAFAESDPMLFQMEDPYTFIRNNTEAALREQVAGAVLESIRTFDTPKFLTMGAKSADGQSLTVIAYGFCVRAELSVADGDSNRETLDSTLTFLFDNIGQPGGATSRSYIDLHADAQQAFDDQDFRIAF